jgi:hypothetical protein
MLFSIVDTDHYEMVVSWIEIKFREGAMVKFLRDEVYTIEDIVGMYF